MSILFYNSSKFWTYLGAIVFFSTLELFVCDLDVLIDLGVTTFEVYISLTYSLEEISYILELMALSFRMNYLDAV